MCLYPRIMHNPKYKSNKKNGGIIPAYSDIRVTKVAVGCGKCIECKKQKARQWQVRLLEDVKEHKNGHFVTLTFSNEEITKIYKDKKINKTKGYELDNAAAKLAVRRFLERWRKEYKKSVRHWLVTEIGHNGTENIHLHGIIWTDKKIDEIRKHWKYGYIWGGYEDKKTYVNEKTVNYITKYITKRDEKHKNYESIILTSAGIGSNYTKQMASEHNKYIPNKTNDTYKTKSGHKIALPIYYRNKLYTEEQREKLWIEKLDKGITYIMGEEINIDKNKKEYYEALEYYRKINKRLGYGDIKKEWSQKQYEEQRRTIQQQKRITNEAAPLVSKGDTGSG